MELLNLNSLLIKAFRKINSLYNYFIIILIINLLHIFKHLKISIFVNLILESQNIKYKKSYPIIIKKILISYYFKFYIIKLNRLI
jgi:hypothetical protein